MPTFAYSGRSRTATPKPDKPKPKTAKPKRKAETPTLTDDLTGKYSAADLIKHATVALGGQGGGGRPDMAQGGGPDASKADDAVAAIRAALAG